MPALAWAKTDIDLKEIWRRLQQQSGSEKVKLMLKLSSIYTGSHIYRPDSALFYAERAFNYAESVNDTEGYRRAGLVCANVSLQLSLINKGLYYYQRCHNLASQANDEKGIVLATRGIGQALWYAGKFGQAIDSVKKVIDYFKTHGLRREHADATMVLSSVYSDMGHYEKALELALQSLWLSQTSGDQANIILSLAQMGYLYKNVGDYATALTYFNQAFAYNPPFEEWCYRILCGRMGELYSEQKKYDSALYFYNRSLASHAESKTSLLRMANYWLERQQYQKAQTYFSKVYRQLHNTGEGNLIVFALVGLGKTSLAAGNLNQALRFGYEALALARQRESKLTLRDALHLLHNVYDKMDNADSAYFFFKQYVAEKEAVVSDQFKGKLFAYKQVSEIRMLKNENLLAEQKLKGNQLLRNILIAGILILLFFGCFIFWNLSLKRKNEKLRNSQVQFALKQRASEMEMQALRAQMNPHFIFNALSSINRFILKNDPEKASDYLTRFSRLIRLVLVNSQRDVIKLEEEMEMLDLYLQMERLRFKNAFTYSITTDENVKPSGILVPPLLLQPFCENAIWHGLMHKEDHGKLNISFTLADDVLQCSIADNGIGRRKAAELESKSAEKIKSLGLQLTSDRLALFNRENSTHTAYEIGDTLDETNNVCGTTVTIRLRHSAFLQHSKPEVVC